MNALQQTYGGSLSLLTDLYQLTMAYGYWKQGLAEREAVFHLTFRQSPFRGAYAIACGLGLVGDYLESWSFDRSDLAYLETLTGGDGRPLFEPAFLHYLETSSLKCHVDAVPEGTVVFPHEPQVRVRGPLWQGQLIETPLLNLVNFQTLVATKAARISQAAEGEPVLEFGLRRSQGIDGGLAASRAAYVGGCSATSNLLAGKVYGIPVKGTHAHSWVMAFEDEQVSFQAYADALPNNCVFLVDTYDTIEGVRRAIAVGLELEKSDHRFLGIRLDSGDLAQLSITARKMLDDAGLSDAAIVASNDLDEYEIRELKRRGATISVWGVGTRLATAYDQPALGGVYKLAALRDEHGEWVNKVKLSEQELKVSNPGIQQVRRYRIPDRFCFDMIYDERQGASSAPIAVQLDNEASVSPPVSAETEELLLPVFRDGQLVGPLPSIHEARERAQSQLRMLAEPHLRHANAQPYPVGLEEQLYRTKRDLIAAHKGRHTGDTT